MLKFFRKLYFAIFLILTVNLALNLGFLGLLGVFVPDYPGSWLTVGAVFGCFVLNGLFSLMAIRFFRSADPLALGADSLDMESLEADKIREKQMAALGLLTNGAVHDLNNILSGIATYPDILLMDDNLGPVVKTGLITIKESGQKAADIVGDLLIVSRDDSLERVVMDINQVLENYLDSHDFDKLLKRYPGIDIQVETASNLLGVRASMIQVEKCFVNLLDYALEEVQGESNGTIWVTTSNRRLISSMPDPLPLPSGVYSSFTVRDNGPGCDSQDTARLFEPFYITQQMRRKGTGLGLSVVQQIAVNYGGQVTVLSDSSGTQFDLYIPSL